MAPYKMCGQQNKSPQINFSDAVNEFQVKSLVPNANLYESYKLCYYTQLMIF